MRPDTRWLGVGIASLAAAGLLSTGGLAAWAGQLRIAEIDRSPGALVDVARTGLAFAAVLVAAAVAAAALTRMAAGGLGPIDRARLRRLRAAPVRVSGTVALALGAVATLAVLAMLGGVIAAGARAVDASPSMQPEIWIGWARRLLWIAGGVLCGAGVLELAASRAAVVRALHQTVEQARADAREHGR